MTNDYKFAAYPSEKEIAKRVSNNLFEEVYTDLDIDRNIRTNADRGYHFDFPSLWLSEFGPHKAIAPRRLQVIPSLHIMKFMISIYDGDDPIRTKIFTYNIIEETSFEEWITSFVYDFHNWSENSEKMYSLDYYYNYRTGELALLISKYHNNTVTPGIPFGIEYESENPFALLEFLNQECSDQNLDYLIASH